MLAGDIVELDIVAAYGLGVELEPVRLRRRQYPETSNMRHHTYIAEDDLAERSTSSGFTGCQ
jgi:hypothetical protein